MTVDDDNSIYVGGLPFGCTESQLHRVFDLYGSIVALKIINDRATGGSCYGFVTFTNPRSAVEAINEMNGKTIGGRVVRVNEANTRGGGGRSMQGRESFRHNQRNTDCDGGRGRGKGNIHDRIRQRDNSRELDEQMDRWRGHSNDREHMRNNFQGKGRDRSRDIQNREHLNSRNYGREPDRNYDLDAAKDSQLDRAVDHDDSGNGESKYNHTKRKHSSSYDQQSKEYSSESSNFYHQEELLELLIKRRDKLLKEETDMGQNLEERKQLIIDLKKRSKKLEDSLTSAKKLTSMHQLQLTKLYKCFQQVKEYGEKLKSSEQELQELVDSVSMEIDPGAVGAREIYSRNLEV